MNKISSITLAPSLPPSLAVQNGLANYVRFYETLTPESLDPGGPFDSLTSETVRFKDPANDVTGQEAYRTVLLHMFEHAKAVSFKVRDIAWGQSGQVAYLRWNFVADVPALGKEPWVVEGMTEVALDKEGRVTAHIDHWDAAEQLHGRLPVIRNIIGFVRGRMRATKSE